MRSWPLIVSLLVWGGCVRDPIDVPCPDVLAGDLVVSEIRGSQSGGATDPTGQWIEIFNPSGSAVSLQGLSVVMRKVDGSAEIRIIVRSDGESVGAGSYAVLGRFPRGTEPAHVTYGYLSDYSENLYSAAEITLTACGNTLDRVIYRTLPTAGSLGFDGGKTLDAASNDTEGAWCADGQGDGKPGTPLARNRPCSL